MKRIFGAIGVLLLVVGLLPVQNVVAQNTNNFRITSYDIQYELSRDSEGRSVLKTTEKIIAEFPDFDQNHGIERAIPSSYDGHPVSFDLIEISDANAKAWDYSTNVINDNSVLRIGDADRYVHGSQTFNLVYTQRDVTRFYTDTGRDEWYWDTNGTEWKVPIDVLNISIKIDPAITGARVGEPACYEGLASATDTCAVIAGENGSYTVRATNLSSGENVTVAFGFKQGTFAQYERSFLETLIMIWGIIQIVAIPMVMTAVIILGVLLMRRIYRMSEQDPIATEYIPPKDASVMVSSQVLTTPQSVFTAQLIDLAVRHFISIIETKEKSTWHAAEYDILIQSDLESLKDEEKEILSDMFGHLPKVGERLALSKLKSDMAYSVRTLDNDKKLKKLVDESYGMKEKSVKDSRFFYKWATALFILGIFSLSFVFGIGALIIWMYGRFFKRLSDKGLELRRYVLGLDKYIKASETERLAFLQGPDTAQKVGYNVDANNPGQIVKLYERVLPYAIMFGQEKEWSKRLGEFYQQANTQPDWYTGNSAFNAVVFASAMSSFSQASSYSAGSSSSSGGSSGGGSSGGGGGGGGGGGW